MDSDQQATLIQPAAVLHPGEIIAGGTVGGCCGLEMGRFLTDGCSIELHVSGIGVLRNKVVASAQAGALLTRV